MITNKNVMLFFRDQADEANVDGIDDMLIVPARNLMSMNPNSDTTIKLHFKSVKNNHNWHGDQLGYDTVDLTVTQGKVEEAMKDIVRTINSAPHGDGFVVIADDMTTTDSDTSALNDLTRSTKYCSTAITGVSAINVSDALYRTDLPGIGTGNVAPTATAAGALAVNTHYINDDTASTAYTIPTAANGKAGDWITVTYTVSIGNTNTHTYTTADTNFAVGSLIRNQGGSRVGVVDVSTTNDDRVLITGDTNGDGGIGSVIRFVNVTGAADGWAVDAELQPQGTGAEACGALTATGFVAV
tara:strand:- start:470 stop:1366 length:897 start_codon:yes stop_codon:yes gene_type:complete